MMLQLPQAKPTRFTQAQIADIGRGAEVRVRAKPSADPIIKALERLERLRVAYVIARDRRDALMKLHPANIFETPKVFLSGGDMLLIGSIAERGFATPRAIDVWAKKYTDQAKSDIQKNGGRWNMGSRCIKRIRELKPMLKHALERHQKQRRTLLRKIGFARLNTAAEIAFMKWYDARWQAVQIAPTSATGVSLLLEFARVGAKNEAVEKESTLRLSPDHIQTAIRSAQTAISRVAGGNK